MHRERDILLYYRDASSLEFPRFIYETPVRLIYSDIIETLIDVYVCTHISRISRAMYPAFVTERLPVARNIGDNHSLEEILLRSLCELRIRRINTPAESRVSEYIYMYI